LHQRGPFRQRYLPGTLPPDRCNVLILCGRDIPTWSTRPINMFGKIHVCTPWLETIPENLVWTSRISPNEFCRSNSVVPDGLPPSHSLAPGTDLGRQNSLDVIRRLVGRWQRERREGKTCRCHSVRSRS